MTHEQVERILGPQGQGTDFWGRYTQSTTDKSRQIWGNGSGQLILVAFDGDTGTVTHKVYRNDKPTVGVEERLKSLFQETVKAIWR